MEDLPLLPGYKFEDPTIQSYRLAHKLDYLNGFRVIRDSHIGIGGRYTDVASCAYIEDTNHIEYDPSLTYGKTREYRYRRFLPHYALYAQKCLRFQAFFRQGVFNSPDEHFRIRYVNIIYYLEDDTLSVLEPTINNAGFQQGKLVRRAKITKNKAGDFFHWKDFNVGLDVCIYGVVYHILNCDPFSREFLNSQGIEVGEAEEPPVDPYIQLRNMKDKVPTRITPIPDDPRRRFLEYDRMILSFQATWNDDVYEINYFLTDDTIAIREIHKSNDGKDPVALLLRRTKVPKNSKDFPMSYPSIYMEYGDHEVQEYYAPKDFVIGETVFIFGRRFFLHDCSPFTRKYYAGMLGIEQPEKIPLSTEKEERKKVYVPPPHIQFGKPEDTYTSCLSFIPKQPKKNVIRQLLNFPKKLRYSVQLDAVHPEDKDRDFILIYNLSDGTISIKEIEKRNSGRHEGCFLSSMLIAKPGTGRDNPRYYTPEDFFVGARLNIFNHHFIINGADLFVYRYIESNPEKFPRDLRDNMRNYFLKEGLLQGDITQHAKKFEQENESEEITVEGTLKNNFDTELCLRDFEADDQRKYEDEHDELKLPSPSTDEACSNSIPVNKPELDVQTPKSENEQHNFISNKKELKWSDQVNYDKAGHAIVSCVPERPACKTKYRECTPPSYFANRDKRSEVQQLLYETATS